MVVSESVEDYLEAILVLQEKTVMSEVLTLQITLNFQRQAYQSQ